MIVVHELAHLKEREHDKAFYQLCRYMEADYHQFEFDLRAYLSYLAAGGEALWLPAAVDAAESVKPSVLATTSRHRLALTLAGTAL